jgi:cytochrome c-type biogenesis protein CcsB
MYEFSTAAALAVTGAFLLLMRRFGLRWLGLFVVTPVLLTLGVAVTLLYTPGTESLVPALNSYWLPIHVTAAVVSAGIFTVAAAITLLYLVVDRAEQRVSRGLEAGWAGYLADRLPTADRLDRLAFRTIAFAFPIWTFAVVAGAIWAEDAWGRYWGWDPKETWAFITWVVYAAYLHARSTAGWRGNRATWIAVAGYSTFIINYFGVNIFASGLHSYSGM